ncbi:hypothetical protein A2392_01670 [Candidatus Kaiserbacteria bacterium RIFOXYB1_FULL_46_14]|uniref:DUF202 domain-containing protein n=1 Tax=Candidatus Kaiserbacteria bacterium RIFOXYB1_FULL_46_14 TaxID=1798531 RepID=A0A1F6FJV7_9BACT|nr:MAG: hypothetical protein A2392_01670 [Candidatus Kaiserbacteria bacterium RIFOXYB1_FULL_46_14]
MVKDVKEEQLLLSEIQVLLAELRTHLSLVRTGAGIVVSASSLAFLFLANSALLPTVFTDYGMVMFGILFLSIIGGVYLFVRSERKILAITGLIKDAEKKNKRIDKLMV